MATAALGIEQALENGGELERHWLTLQSVAGSDDLLSAAVSTVRALTCPSSALWAFVRSVLAHAYVSQRSASLDACKSSRLLPTDLS